MFIFKIQYLINLRFIINDIFIRFKDFRCITSYNLQTTAEGFVILFHFLFKNLTFIYKKLLGKFIFALHSKCQKSKNY